MKRLCIFFALLLVIAPAAYSRLGESVEECAVRYGQARGRTGAFTIYTKNGINAECVFDAEQRCCLIRFSAAGELELGMIDALLLANAGTAKWAEIGDPTEPEVSRRIAELLEVVGGREWAEQFQRGRNWKADDGTRVAVFRDGHLIVATTAALDAYRAAGKRQAEGF